MDNRKLNSSAMLVGVESSAVTLLSRAVEHDTSGRYPAALACYQEGIQLFLDIIKRSEDHTKLDVLRKKAKEYMTRAEKIKELIQKQKDLETYHEQIQIPNDGVGYSYQSIFHKYLDKAVTKVEVEDPYVRNTHQTYNFLVFCELLVKSCSELKEIILITGYNDHEQANQKMRFQCMKESLIAYNIELTIQFSTTLHDREIRLDSGWIIKIGRGLDFFKPTKKFSIGFSDQSFRSCHETTVDIYFKNR